MAASRLPAMESRSRIRRLWFFWVVGISLLQSLHRIANAQSGGFINIDCGAPDGFAYQHPDTNLTFESDASFISTGVAASTGDAVVTDLTSLRFFPASSPAKNCYELAVTNNTQYLARAWFYFGGYTAVPATGINFQISVDETVWTHVTIDTTPNTYSTYEVMLLTTKPSVSVCLIRLDSSDPFINTLELRPINRFSYIANLDDTRVIMNLLRRRNFGEETTTFRFPFDSFDRLWPPLPKSSGATYTSLFAPGYPNSPDQILYNGSIQADYPPAIVMQSAFTDPNLLNYSVTVSVFDNPTPQIYAFLFFAEINNTATSGLSRIIDFQPNFLSTAPPGYVLDITTISPPFTTYQFGGRDYTIPSVDKSELVFTLLPDARTDLPPIVNAFELYQIIKLGSPTNEPDATVLAAVKLALSYSRWTGDPCNPVPWEGITCTKNSVTALDLSGKGLSGPIPTAISSLASLKSLNLSDNQFSGPLPTWVGQFTSLSVLDVSNNDLNGSFPATYFAKIADFRYAGNELQCVASANSICPQGTPPAATTSPPPPGATTSPPPPGGSGTESKSSTSIGPVIGGVVGGILVLLVIVFVVLWCCCRKTPATQGPPTPITIFPDASPGYPQATPSHLHPGRKAHPYALSTVKEATNNFARKIGEGGFGPVYYGLLKEQEVAVKVMSGKSQQGLNEFSNEIDLLSTVHYKKLVSLVGYCEEGAELILLYEYMSGGDLRARLYSSKVAQLSPLNWRQRLQIALDAARGLEYLHHGCNPAIFHRDVKSSNILLNNKLEAKVADFGLSKLTDDGQTHVMTMVKGTLGYLDPEYNTTGMLTDKSDVYSFGVVLLEILCGHPPILQEGPHRFIVEKVRAAMNTGSLATVVDPALKGDYKVESVWRFAEIAMSCVPIAASARPGMSKVVSELTQTLELEFGEQRGEWANSSGATYSDKITLNPPDVKSSNAGYSATSGHSNFSNYSNYSTDQPSQVFLADEGPRAY